MTKHLRINKLAFYTIAFVFIVGCDRKPDEIDSGECPNFNLGLSSPYEDPLPHPSGLYIGFNHTPLTEIHYNYGYDCPLQATYIYDYSNSGFWLADSEGNNQRKVLPYYLLTPQWSPDGKWIAFSKDGNIYKMPFDGISFDTLSVIQLTNGNHNFYPAWSKNGEYIAYHNTECGSALEPIPPNSCGILIIDSHHGSEKNFIINEGRRHAYWGHGTDTLFFGLSYYDLINKRENIFVDVVRLGLRVFGRPLYSLQKEKIFFCAKHIYSDDSIQIYSVSPTGADLMLVSEEPVLNFSITPEGKIVYVLYDGIRLDEGKGALWLMDDDGSNIRQLTFNDTKYYVH